MEAGAIMENVSIRFYASFMSDWFYSEWGKNPHVSHLVVVTRKVRGVL